MEGYASGGNDPNTPLTDLSTVKEKETHRKSNKWLQRENHPKIGELV